MLRPIGDVITVEALPSFTFGQLKVLVFAADGTPTRMQRILWQDVEQSDTDTLVEKGVEDGSTVAMLMTIAGGAGKRARTAAATDFTIPSMPEDFSMTPHLAPAIGWLYENYREFSASAWVESLSIKKLQEATDITNMKHLNDKFK